MMNVSRDVENRQARCCAGDKELHSVWAVGSHGGGENNRAADLLIYPFSSDARCAMVGAEDLEGSVWNRMRCRGFWLTRHSSRIFGGAVLR